MTKKLKYLYKNQRTNTDNVLHLILHDFVNNQFTQILKLIT